LLLSVLLPSFPKALQNKRKAIPFGLYIKAKKQSKDVVFYLIGVHPDYQNKPSQQSFSANTTIPSKEVRKLFPYT
jgi:hypothetical protein